MVRCLMAQIRILPSFLHFFPFFSLSPPRLGSDRTYAEPTPWEEFFSPMPFKTSSKLCPGRAAHQAGTKAFLSSWCYRQLSCTATSPRHGVSLYPCATVLRAQARAASLLAAASAPLASHRQEHQCPNTHTQDMPRVRMLCSFLAISICLGMREACYFREIRYFLIVITSITISKFGYGRYYFISSGKLMS